MSEFTDETISVPGLGDVPSPSELAARNRSKYETDHVAVPDGCPVEGCSSTASTVSRSFAAISVAQATAPTVPTTSLSTTTARRTNKSTLHRLNRLAPERVFTHRMG